MTRHFKTVHELCLHIGYFLYITWLEIPHPTNLVCSTLAPQLYAMAAVGSGELLPPSRLHVNSTSNIVVTSASLELEQSPPLLALVLYILV